MKAGSKRIDIAKIAPQLVAVDGSAKLRRASEMVNS
jgi:hypothetical protein